EASPTRSGTMPTGTRRTGAPPAAPASVPRPAPKATVGMARPSGYYTPWRARSQIDNLYMIITGSNTRSRAVRRRPWARAARAGPPRPSHRTEAAVRGLAVAAGLDRRAHARGAPVHSDLRQRHAPLRLVLPPLVLVGNGARLVALEEEHLRN